MSDLTFTVDVMGNWEYGGMIPSGLYGMMGQPLSLHFEQTGKALDALRAFCENRLQGAEMQAQHLQLLIQYCRHYINAPIWLAPVYYPDGNCFEPEIEALQEMVKGMETADDLDKFVHQCLDIGLDPF